MSATNPPQEGDWVGGNMVVYPGGFYLPAGSQPPDASGAASGVANAAGAAAGAVLQDAVKQTVQSTLTTNTLIDAVGVGAGLILAALAVWRILR